MLILGYLVFVIGFITSCVSAQDLGGLKLVQRTLSECSKINDSYSCISNKVGRAVERSMDWNIPLLDGVTLVRNKHNVNYRQARLMGSDRLRQALLNFLDTHEISLELGGARNFGRKGGGGGHGGGGGYGGGLINKKQLKKEKKYGQYAFMVLLGIFGLTGPLVMKVLGLMAAKALLAAKAALIIVGSVALKKLFTKERHEPIIKVHTVEHDHDHEEEYDRMSKHGIFAYGYRDNTLGQSYNSPYNSYYDDYYGSSVTKNNVKI